MSIREETITGLKSLSWVHLVSTHRYECFRKPEDTDKRIPCNTKKVLVGRNGAFRYTLKGVVDSVSMTGGPSHRAVCAVGRLVAGGLITPNSDRAFRVFYLAIQTKNKGLTDAELLEKSNAPS